MAGEADMEAEAAAVVLVATAVAEVTAVEATAEVAEVIIKYYLNRINNVSCV